ncbi:ABC-2 type transport system permease protein [Solirubrobacter pauli]|uniref:Transport permease protein n=1 Tax=Solirubrobacter pauli TaxID=166793 RepID=A0A660LGB9_9ACTN|nr:ABC transporter permease [Solirubrobacter pauli]RKQ92873.1 ABC-2 type transport system permease protein [Solirubrobacter pauli]
MSTVSTRHRPLVLGRDARRFWQLTLTLATTDFKLRFYGSVLGYAWTLVRPFAFFGVIWLVFAEIVGAGEGVKNYPAYILMALVLFQFFGGVVAASLTCLVDRQSLLRKIRFPRLVIPLAVTLASLLDLVGTLAAVFVFLLLLGVYPDWGWLELVPILGLLMLFSTGLGLLLSVLFVRFRDMKPIWDVGSQMLFYASPILYVATAVPDNYERWYLMNPLSTIFTQMRHAVVDSTAPSAADLMGGAVYLLIPLAIIVGTAVLGAWAFVREAPRVAENL